MSVYLTSTSYMDYSHLWCMAYFWQCHNVNHRTENSDQRQTHWSISIHVEVIHILCLSVALWRLSNDAYMYVVLNPNGKLHIHCALSWFSQMAAILNFTNNAISKVLSNHFTMSGIPYGRHKNYAFASILSKMMSIYSLTLQKLRPSQILPTMQCPK